MCVQGLPSGRLLKGPAIRAQPGVIKIPVSHANTWLPWDRFLCSSPLNIIHISVRHDRDGAVVGYRVWGGTMNLSCQMIHRVRIRQSEMHPTIYSEVILPDLEERVGPPARDGSNWVRPIPSNLNEL